MLGSSLLMVRLERRAPAPRRSAARTAVSEWRHSTSRGPPIPLRVPSPWPGRCCRGALRLRSLDLSRHVRNPLSRARNAAASRLCSGPIGGRLLRPPHPRRSPCRDRECLRRESSRASRSNRGGFDGTFRSGRRREGQGSAGRADLDPGAGSGPGRGAGAGAGLRGVSHRSPLPRGRYQRRLPVPARSRGGGHRGSGRAGRDRREAGRLRGAQLASGVRHLPFVSAGQAQPLLQHVQCDPEDDAGRRHATVGRPRHRSVRRQDPRGGRAVHARQSGSQAGSGRSARLRGDGRPRCGDAHR